MKRTLSFRPLCLIVFLFCLHFCILSHFEINRCIVKLLIVTSMPFLLNHQNLKCFFGHQNSGTKTGIPVSWTARISHWNFYNSIESTDVLNKIKLFSSRRRLLLSGKHFIVEVFVKANRKVPLKNGTNDFLIVFRLRDRPVFMWQSL